MINTTKSENARPILVTGAAGFIGFHLCQRLLRLGFTVVGIDNLNDYYDVSLKVARLIDLGLPNTCVTANKSNSSKFKGEFIFYKVDIGNKQELEEIFQLYKIDIVCHLAAQAGVRYSIDNPKIYGESNLIGFLNILECCRQFNSQRLVYASSSSVYGDENVVPFTEKFSATTPVSLYAATKRSNELMAYAYTKLYNFETVGLRFFTVYGPWGRPDMAIYIFTQKILNGEPISVYNKGELSRDFTYIDDVIDGLERVVLTSKEFKEKSRIYNLGFGKPTQLLEFISHIERKTNKAGIKDYREMQAGDVSQTWADTSSFKRDYNFHPIVPIKEGVDAFIEWYIQFNKQDIDTSSKCH